VEKPTGRAFAEAGVPHVVAVPLAQKKSISERTPVKRLDIEGERAWLNRSLQSLVEISKLILIVLVQRLWLRHYKKDVELCISKDMDFLIVLHLSMIQENFINLKQIWFKNL
jgi:hypothetical protein